jgi:type I restriction enzyme, S subunit
VGPISRNNVGQGVMSPLYTVFRFRSNETDFYEHYFKSAAWHSYVRSAASTGARHDRMSITTNAFMRMPLLLPSPAERQKVADCLTSLDDVIAAQARKVEALNAHKRGLMQQLFPLESETVPRLRFPEFRGDWKERALGALCENVTSGRDKPDSNGAFDLYGSTGVIGRTNTATYNGRYLLVARVGANAGFLTDARGQFGVTDNTIVIALADEATTDFIYFYLQSVELNRMIYGSGQPLITGTQLKNLGLYLPEVTEQQRVAGILASLDAEVRTESEKLISLRSHKAGLMQQLFPAPDAN